MDTSCSLDFSSLPALICVTLPRRSKLFQVQQLDCCPKRSIQNMSQTHALVQSKWQSNDLIGNNSRIYDSLVHEHLVGERADTGALTAFFVFRSYRPTVGEKGVKSLALNQDVSIASLVYPHCRWRRPFITAHSTIYESWDCPSIVVCLSI